MGDKEFEEFFNKGEDSKNLPIYLLLCLKEKSKLINDLHTMSCDLYSKTISTAPKDMLREQELFIKKLQKEALSTFRQFDEIIIDAEPYDDEQPREDDDPCK